MTDPKMLSFFKAIIGDDGAGALVKAAEKSEALAGVIFPRGIISWLSFATRWPYDVEIPGIPQSNIHFKKNDYDLLDGAITVGEDSYEFENADVLHLAASVAVALGIDNVSVDPKLRKSDISGLGDNIDLLVKTRFLTLLDLQKGGHGRAAEPLAPEAPQAPEKVKPPKSTVVTDPGTAEGKEKKTKKKEVKVSKAQAEEVHCTVCDAPQFTNGRFTGCYCLRDLAKHSTAEIVDGGYSITFGDEWSNNDVAVFMDIIGGKA